MFLHPSTRALVHSPSDLTVFLESRFATWMNRAYLDRTSGVADSFPAPAPPDEAAELIIQKGRDFEAAYLERIRNDAKTVVDLSNMDGGTLDLRAGADVYYQAKLSLDPFSGYADFLERVDGASKLGDFHYEVVDTKLARSARPDFLIQLCAYAEMLEALQGRRPSRIHVELGNGKRESFRTDDFWWFYLALKNEYLAFIAAFDPKMRPEPEAGADHGKWQAAADAYYQESDHLSNVAGITRIQIRKLRAEGIETATALAATTAARIPGIQDTTFQRLRRQAGLQRDSAGLPVPIWEPVPPDPDDPRPGLAELPPASPGDVFFDMEGFPLVENGLEYLFGAVADGVFHSWWAHDSTEEKTAFENFVDFVQQRLIADPGMHVFHYAPYEVTALRRLAGRYGTREAEVDGFLRRGIFVDLFRIVRTSIRVGTTSYSLKAIEALYRPKRAGEVATGSDSIVEYDRWRKTREARILEGIRAYNCEDCQSLIQLCDWLRAEQAKLGHSWEPPSLIEEPVKPHPRQALINELLASQDPVRNLLGQLVGFHVRESRPIWWAYFARQQMTEEELFEDLDCLAGLVADGPSRPAGRSSLERTYKFDPDQDTKLTPRTCYLAQHESVKVAIVELDRSVGRAVLKIGPKVLTRLDGNDAPLRVSLLPDEIVPATVIENAIADVSEAADLPPALADLLYRRPPCFRGGAVGAVVAAGEDPSEAAVRRVGALDSSYLCIQGPPGTGKTWTAARMIVSLLAQGKKIGITANSHKVIMNLVAECARTGTIRGVKVGGDEDDPERAQCPDVDWAEDVKGVRLTAGTFVAGTAWVFCHPLMKEKLDYLFVDEAGQVSLANLAGMSRSAKNLVLLGDQMQLEQPILGSHPGQSGLSALQYLMGDHATIPADLGIFLETTHRLHPKICSFISGAVYEDRLLPHPRNEHRIIRHRAGGSALIPVEAGIVFVPVPHEGNSQASDEEVRAIDRIVTDLLGRMVIDESGSRELTLRDILFVAPYNMQVRRLQQRLGPNAEVGSVDRFQGRQAPVVIVSMCASQADASPRGMEFLLDRNRLNVAVSRARSLAIVVGSPDLVSTRCTSVRQMHLLNTISRLVFQGGTQGDPIY